MWLLKLTFMLVGSYVVVVGIAYFLQTWLIFPSGLAGGNIDLPEEASYLELETEDNGHFVLVRIPPGKTPSKPRPMLLGFGGNAWNADAVAIILHRIFPEHEIAALHYRGYGPSSGRPSARAIFADARRAHDEVAGNLEAGIVAVGFSIGASVAVELAASRPVRGLVLVTPFDSLKELAANHYPWLPVRWLLRHRMEASATLRNLDVPAAVITAENDLVVPSSRSQPIIEAAANLRADFTIRGAGHNDVYERGEFIKALRSSVDAVVQE